MKQLLVSLLFLFTVDFVGNTVIITNLNTNEIKIIQIDPTDIVSGHVDAIVKAALK